MKQHEPTPRRRWRTAHRDLVVIGALALATALLAVRFRWAERYLRFAREHEQWAVGEASAALLIGFLALGLFAWRRWRELAHEVRRRRAMEGDLIRQALTDPLTGLANRSLFQDRVAHAMARRRRTGDPIVVMFLDLDGFKRINDSLGHAAGDALLAEVARRLLHCIRGADTAARLGGDEFAVLLDGLRSPEDADVVADRVREALREPVALEEQEVVVTASIGLADTQTATDAGTILRNADLAMYAAKQQGRGDWVRFRPEMHSALLAELARETDLRRAVLELDPGEQFCLEYQPIMELRTNAVSGVEALVRWDHPERGRLLPADFVPLAESTGLIVRLGEWVLREACMQLARWDAQAGEGVEPPPSLSVNISAAQLHHPAFAEQVRDALETAGIAPTRLVIELTETLMIRAEQETLDRIESLRAIGVRFAIDDFGTGYSALGYLQSLPVDIVKIDRSFISGTRSVELDSAVALSILALARSLGLRVVAEGVETTAQADWLREQGAEWAQGFVFAYPAPAHELGSSPRPRTPAPD